MKKAGLYKIDGLDLPTDTRKYYVVVSPEAIRPKIRVPKSYFEEKDKGLVHMEGETSTDEGDFEEWDEEGQGMAVDEDQEMATGEGQEMAASTLFPVFHYYPVRMEELFTSKGP